MRPAQKKRKPPKSHKGAYLGGLIIIAIIIGIAWYVYASNQGGARDFTIAASTPSAVDAGKSASSMFTITPSAGVYGLHTVTLVTDPGLTCNPIQPVYVNGSKTIPLSCTAATGGTFNATVTDTSGSIARTTVVSFSFRDFKVDAPTGIVIHPGVPSTATVTVSSINQYSETVHLVASASQGLNATISPATITGSGTATLTVASSNAGNYTVTITGTSGALTHSMTPKVATPIYAKLSTSNGVIEVELYQNLAPKTVANFVNLANQGFYSNLVWHRIVKGFVIQTGDPNTRGGAGDRSTWGSGGSSQTVPLEIDSSLHNNVGYLGMARGSDVNSGSSQFYINLANNNSLDGKYTVFGKVIAGMDVALAIGNVSVDSNSQPISLVYLSSVTISTSP